MMKFVSRDYKNIACGMLLALLPSTVFAQVPPPPQGVPAPAVAAAPAATPQPVPAPAVAAPVAAAIQPAVAPVEVPVMVPPAQNTAPTAIAAIPMPQTQQISGEPIIHSLFFTPDEISLLNQASWAYDRTQMNISSDAQNQAKNFLSQLENKNTTASLGSGEYPQFFLESLVYHTPTDWFVQVNGQKFTNDAKEKGGLKVIKVDGDRLYLEWKPVNMQLVVETLAKTHNTAPTVQVDQAAGTVSFSLLPNQTFSSYTMSVMEGKLKPTSIQVK